MRNPARKTVAPASTQYGQSGPRGPFRLAAKAEPQHPAEEPRQRRIRERHAGEDVAVVEEPQRDGEREQHEQVDVPQPKRPAPVEEPEQEDRAEREPDDGPVERLAAERARAASRHLPRDLWAGPRLVDAAGRVVDLAEGDLAGLTRPDTDGPVARRALELGVGGGLRRVAVEPGRDLRVGEEEPRHARLGQPRPARSRRERRVDEAALLVVDRGGRPGRRPGRPGEAGQGRDGDHDRRQATTQRRKDQSLLPMKFNGVTSTIAIAWATIFPTPPWIRKWSTARFASSATVETTRKRKPW